MAPRKQHPRLTFPRPPQRLLWLVAALLVLAELGLFAYSRTTSAWEHVRSARALLGTASGAGAASLAQLGQACAELDAARADAAPLLPFARLGWLVPLDRAHAWAQAPDLAAMAEHGCEAARAGNRLLGVVNAQAEGSAGAAVLSALQGDRRDVELAGSSGAQALAALDRLDPSSLEAEDRFRPFLPMLQTAKEHRAELAAGAELGPRLADLAGRMLGGDRARTYLLVGQNNDEIRATGGFIGTLGLLTLAEGRVAATDVRSSYLWDRPDRPKPPAPQPLQQYMNFGGWYLRDANWWIDFRRTAAQLLLMWEREQGNAAGIDGVVAIDRVALDELLDAVGGVDVPELGGHVTSSTVGDALDERRRSREALQSYADYHLVKTQALSALHGALMKKVTAARGSELLKVVEALGRAADEKHVLVWFRDNDLQALAYQRGWDGHLDTGTGDFTGVVDSSISYGKVSPYIDRKVEYHRRPDGTALVQLTYTNRFQVDPGAPWDPLIDGTWWDWKASVFRRDQGTWLDYARVLAPMGSRLVSADGWDDAPSTSAEEPVTVFGAPLLVRPGETRTATLVYSDPRPGSPLTQFVQPGR